MQFGAVVNSSSCTIRDTSIPGEPSAASGRSLVRTWLILCPSTVHLVGDRRQAFVESMAQSLPGSTGWSTAVDFGGFEIDTLPYVDNGLVGTVVVAFSAPTDPFVIAITLDQAAPP